MGTVFGVIVVVGVAGESFFGVRIWWNNRKLHTLQNAESERLRGDVASANVRAEEAKEQAARANERAAEANKVAEQERLARLRLEATLAPRSLTPEQQRTLAAALKDLNIGQQNVDIFRSAMIHWMRYFRSS